METQKNDTTLRDIDIKFANSMTLINETINDTTMRGLLFKNFYENIFKNLYFRNRYNNCYTLCRKEFLER
jgi:hypothetical protein